MAHALHYPTIEFQDLNALKRSLLIWDRIGRIVPREYEPEDQAEVRTAVSENVVLNLTVDTNEKSKAAHKFLDFYALREKPQNPLAWPAGFNSIAFNRLNEDKIDAKLLPLFEELSRRYTSDGFLQVPSEIAGAYMFYLATEIANQRNLELTTASADCWTVGTYFANEGCFTELIRDEKADSYLASLAIDDLLPADMSGVDIDDILKFREKTIEVRAEFHLQLDLLRRELSRCNNKEHAKFIVGDFVKRFESAKAEYKSSVSFFRKDGVCSLLSVGLPTALCVLALPGFSANPYSPLSLCTGTAIGAVAALGSREMQKKPKTIASFLVHADKLSTKNQNHYLSKIFNEFIND